MKYIAIIDKGILPVGTGQLRIDLTSIFKVFTTLPQNFGQKK